jgi:hypothetical protein
MPYKTHPRLHISSTLLEINSSYRYLFQSYRYRIRVTDCCQFPVFTYHAIRVGSISNIRYIIPTGFDNAVVEWMKRVWCLLATESHIASTVCRSRPKSVISKYLGLYIQRMPQYKRNNMVEYELGCQCNYPQEEYAPLEVSIRM